MTKKTAKTTNNTGAPPHASSTVSGERNQLTSSSSTRLGSSTVTEYYRIIVRTEGVRDTVSFSETLVHF